MALSFSRPRCLTTATSRHPVPQCAKTGDTINICDKALLTKPSRVKEILARIGARRRAEEGASRGSVLVTAPKPQRRGVMQSMRAPLFQRAPGGSAAVAPTESVGSVSAHSTRGAAGVPGDVELGSERPPRRKLGKGVSVRQGASTPRGGGAGSFGLHTFAKMPSTRGDLYATSDTPVFHVAQELWRDERLGHREQYELYRLHNVNTMLCVRVNDPGTKDAGLAVLQVANKIGQDDDTLFNKHDEQVLEVRRPDPPASRWWQGSVSTAVPGPPGVRRADRVDDQEQSAGGGVQGGPGREGVW